MCDNSLMQLLFIVLPIFILIAIGYFLRKVGLITREGISILNSFVYYVSLPAVILMSFWGINWLDSDTQSTLIANTVLLIGFAILLFLLVRTLPISPKMQAGIFGAALVGNTVYMGFPIAERALEEGGFHLYVAAATPHLVLGITLTILVIERLVVTSQRPAQYFKDFFFNPLILSLLGGIALSLSGVTGAVVDLIKEIGGMLAATASPIALITLGAFLYKVFQPRLAMWGAVAASINLILLPFFIFIGGNIIGLDPSVIVASVLAAAMPTAVTSFVIAERYDAAPDLVATTLFMSTICSLGTISVLILFFV